MHGNLMESSTHGVHTGLICRVLGGGAQSGDGGEETHLQEVEG